MAIIEPVSSPDEPLAQGDILQNVPLHVTVTSDVDGEAVKQSARLCMIVSRNCVAMRNELITVAAIETYKKTVGDFEDFKECLAFYQSIRDGLTTPDQLYLGQLDGINGALCARFDNLFTVKIPADIELRNEFARTRRIARLNNDFIHDLHQRLTRAFASCGFDDHAWYSTQDLRTVISYGKREETRLQLALSEVEAQADLGTAGLTTPSQRDAKSNEVIKRRTRLEEFTNSLQPYRDELSRRESATPLRAD